MQHGNVGASPYRSAPGLDQAQCEVLFELFHGAAGPVHLGRLLRGNDTGRTVVLRALAGEPSPELSSAVDVSRSIAHPRLAKVLGIVRDAERWYLASEFIPGVTFFELAQTVARRGTRLKPEVAARIGLDALKAASEAQRLLLATAQLADVRCLFPESIWVADYGEVFVSDVLIAPLLFADTSSAANAERAEALDVSATAMALAQLVQLESSSANAEVPAPLSKALTIATRGQGSAGYAALAEFIAALSELDEALVATDEEVGKETERVMGATSEWRRQRLEMLQRSPGEGEPAEAEATRVFRVAPREARAEDGRRHEEATVIFSKPPENDPSQQETLSTPKAAPNDSEATISAVWREARAVMDSPRGGTRRARKPTPRVGIPAATAEPVPEPTPIAEQAAPETPSVEQASDVGTSLRTFVIAILVTLAVSAALYAAFGSHPAAPAAPPHSSTKP